MSAPPLTAVVADDEQPARDELCYLLDQIDGVEVVAQAANGPEAVETIVRLDPDLAFLDIQMPGLSGLEVVRRLQEAGTSASVVFVTAFDHQAVEAFEVHAEHAAPDTSPRPSRCGGEVTGRTAGRGPVKRHCLRTA